MKPLTLADFDTNLNLLNLFAKVLLRTLNTQNYAN
ncbi:hypothetical protein BC962_1132 [Gillisia mitskevichiae]|uniref:Uncharacterized protein n=1 Tax=Gillisia mitskevichiae TaxID=270921 RepID=A0A495Q032_9FLAO|nr:hypothetical protein BC962_1132 [Gillisia mitskevichiae]